MLFKDGLENLIDAYESTWISSSGKYLEKSRNQLEEIIGSNVILVSNGTTAMSCVVEALRFKHPDIDQVIVPSNVYVAAWNMFISSGKYDLISVDSDLDTWNYKMDDLEEAMEKYPKAAILCVHNISSIINVDSLKERYPDRIFVEDNCEGFLGSYSGKRTGTSSLCSSSSFFANKSITSGEGGIFVTKDLKILKHIKSYINQGNSPEKYIHSMLGYNYRMTNIQAAILLSQIENLEKIMQQKRRVFERYSKNFKGTRINPQKQETGTVSSFWMYGIKFDKKIASKVAALLNDVGIETRPMFKVFDEHSFLKKKITPFKTVQNSRELQESCLILPSYPSLSDEDVDEISESVKSALNYV